MQEHGDYIVSRSQQVILFAGRGPWNDESLMHGTRQMAVNIGNLDKSRPWAQLSCLFGECLLPPSTFNMFVKQSKIRKEMGLQALAIVILDTDIMNTIKQQLTSAYQEVGIEHAFFTSIVEAIQWLEQQHIELDSQFITQFYNDHPL